MWQNSKGKHPVKPNMKWKENNKEVWVHWGLSPGAHPLIIYASSFTFLFLVSYFLHAPLSFLCVCYLSSVPSVSPLVPCNATDGLCERWGRSQRISIYLTPVCPSSSSHSLIYHTQVLLIVVWQPAPGPGLDSSLWAPVIITLGLCWE